MFGSCSPICGTGASSRWTNSYPTPTCRATFSCGQGSDSAAGRSPPVGLPSSEESSKYSAGPTLVLVTFVWPLGASNAVPTLECEWWVTVASTATTVCCSCRHHERRRRCLRRHAAPRSTSMSTARVSTKKGHRQSNTRTETPCGGGCVGGGCGGGCCCFGSDVNACVCPHPHDPAERATLATNSCATGGLTPGRNSRRQRHSPALDDEELFVIEGSNCENWRSTPDNRRSAKKSAKCAKTPITAVKPSSCDELNLRHLPASPRTPGRPARPQRRPQPGRNCTCGTSRLNCLDHLRLSLHNDGLVPIQELHLANLRLLHSLHCEPCLCEATGKPPYCR